MRSLVKPGSTGEQIGRLGLAAFIVIALPSLPLGNYLSYPFVILTTWFHEMGHGLAALALGQEFERLLIFASGSGLAEYRVEQGVSRFTLATIAAGGLIAPTMAGCMLILASAHQKLWRPALWTLAAIIFASVILYVRSSVGYAVLPLLALAIAVIAWKARESVVRFTLQFLGLLGALSMLSDYRYLFTEEFVMNGRPMLSDSGQIEQALFLPHWIWAGLILALCAAMVVASFKYALSDKRLTKGPKLPANVLQFKNNRED